MIIRLIKNRTKQRLRVFTDSSTLVATFLRENNLKRLTDEDGFILQDDNVMGDVVRDGEILIGFEGGKSCCDCKNSEKSFTFDVESEIFHNEQKRSFDKKEKKKIAEEKSKSIESKAKKENFFDDKKKIIKRKFDSAENHKRSKGDETSVGTKSANTSKKLERKSNLSAAPSSVVNPLFAPVIKTEKKLKTDTKKTQKVAEQKTDLKADIKKLQDKIKNQVKNNESSKKSNKTEEKSSAKQNKSKFEDKKSKSAQEKRKDTKTKETQKTPETVSDQNLNENDGKKVNLGFKISDKSTNDEIYGKIAPSRTVNVLSTDRIQKLTEAKPKDDVKPDFNSTNSATQSKSDQAAQNEKIKTKVPTDTQINVQPTNKKSNENFEAPKSQNNEKSKICDEKNTENLQLKSKNNEAGKEISENSLNVDQKVNKPAETQKVSQNKDNPQKTPEKIEKAPEMPFITPITDKSKEQTFHFGDSKQSLDDFL